MISGPARRRHPIGRSRPPCPTRRVRIPLSAQAQRREDGQRFVRLRPVGRARRAPPVHRLSQLTRQPPRAAAGDSLTVDYTASSPVGIVTSAVELSGPCAGPVRFPELLKTRFTRSAKLAVPANCPIGVPITITVVATDGGFKTSSKPFRGRSRCSIERRRRYRRYQSALDRHPHGRSLPHLLRWGRHTRGGERVRQPRIVVGRLGCVAGRLGIGDSIAAVGRSSVLQSVSACNRGRWVPSRSASLAFPLGSSAIR